MDISAVFDWFDHLYDLVGYPLIFLISLAESTPFGWLTPGGFVLAGGGFFAQSGNLSIFWVAVSGILGTWITLYLAYYLGNHTGMRVAKLLRQELRAKQARRLLGTSGGVVLTTSLLSNVTRFWIAYVAGMQKYNLARFSLYSGIASITWVSLWVSAGFIAGAKRVDIEYILSRLQILAWVLFLIAIAMIYWSGKKGYEEYTDDQ